MSGEASGVSPPLPPGARVGGAQGVAEWLAINEPYATSASAAAAAGGALLLVRAAPGAAIAETDLAAIAAAAAAAARLYGCTVHVKLPVMASPSELPSQALRAVVDGALLEGCGPAAPPLGAIRPGCVLLSIDALVTRLPDISDVATALTCVLGDRVGARVRLGSHESALANAAAPVKDGAPPTMPRLWPAAALLRGGEVLSFLLTNGAPGALHARLNGAALQCTVEHAAPGDAGSRVIVMPPNASSVEGAALFELSLPPADAAGVRVSLPRAVLLCADPDIVAQICRTAECLHALPGEHSVTDDALQLCIRAVGDALAPGAPLRVRTAAAAAAVWLRWDAVLTRLLLVPSAPDGVLVLHAVAHAAAQSGDEASAAVVAAAAARLGSPRAWTAAARLLHDASGAKAHTLSECAARTALSCARDVRDAGPDDDAAAVSILLALVALLDDALAEADDVAASEAARAIATAARESAYVMYLARINVTVFRAASWLSLGGATMQLINCVRFGLLRTPAQPSMTLRDIDFGAVNANLLASIIMHAPPGALPLSPLDVPLGAVVTHVRAFVFLSLLLRLPANVAMVVASHALTRSEALLRHYEPIFLAGLLIDIAFFALMDVLILHATGAAPEWPTLPSVLHAVGLLVGTRRGPFRLRCTYCYMAARTALAIAPLAYVGAWRVLIHNGGYAAQLAVLAAAALSAQRRDAAMRAEYRGATTDAQEAPSKPKLE